MREPVRVLCVLAIPGTGENLLARLLSTISGVRDHGELFSPSEPTARRAPGVTLDLATDLADPDVVAVTVLPGHVSRPLLATEVLGRVDLAPIVLHRRVIDCYLARLDALTPAGGRARANGGPTFTGNIDDFARWATRNARWYRWCHDTIESAGRDPMRITFEREIEAGPAAVRDCVTRVLRPEPDGRVGGSDHESVLSARPTHAPTRIEDWDRFRDSLEERGLLDLAMGYFV